jgi:DNA recombination protein RmuC
MGLMLINQHIINLCGQVKLFFFCSRLYWPSRLGCGVFSSQQGKDSKAEVMDQILFSFAGIVVTPGLLAIVVLVLGFALVLRRPGQVLKDELGEALAQERQRELDEKLATLMRLQGELNGRLAQMGETVDSKHGHLTRVINDRLDGLQARIGEGMNQHLTNTHENLSRMNERLAVIDEAQKRMGVLTSEMLNLKDILSNKQSRGAFGQGRMEAIVRDNLPPSS